MLLNLSEFFSARIQTLGVIALLCSLSVTCGERNRIGDPAEYEPGQEIKVQRNAEAGIRKVGKEWWEYEMMHSEDRRYSASRTWKNAAQLETISCRDHSAGVEAVFFCDPRGLQQREYYSVSLSKTVMLEQFRFPGRSDADYHDCIIGECANWAMPKTDPCIALLEPDKSVIIELCNRIQIAPSEK